MAGLLCVAESGAVSLSADTAKTAVSVKAASNVRLKLLRFFVGISGTAPVDLTIVLAKQTTDGTSTSLTPVKLSPSAAETVQATAGKNFTVEPTQGDILKTVRCQGGYEVIFPLGQEPVLPGGVRAGLTLTCTSAVTARAEIAFEE